MNPSKPPNLFLVGVQRSATTALSRYLARHPDVFMATKELHYFGSDLATCNGESDPSRRLTLEDYLRYFDAARGERYRGDASVGYIYSKTAAKEIGSFCADARIVASFRNPIDMLYSSYSLFRFQGIEQAQDFAEAVSDTEKPRWAYTATDFRWGFTYPGLAHYAEELERYFDVFGRHRVHVLIYEDFVADSTAEYRKVLEFLGVDPAFQPSLEPVFSNRQMRSPLMQRLLWRPPQGIRSIARRIVPSQAARRKVGQALAARNVRIAPREELDPVLRKSLEERFAPEVKRFGDLLGRDMSALWCRASPAAAAT